MKEQIMALIGQIVTLAHREHNECEDPFYSCPKSEGGCLNECNGDECDCGADSVNDEVNSLYEKIKEEWK